MLSKEEAHPTLWQKIEHVRVGMLTTVGPDGALLSRPMSNQQVDADGALWFFVSDEAAVSKQIVSSPNVNVSFAAPEDSLYVSVAGTAALVKDKEKIAAMWNPMVSAWFPKGADDPHVALIRVAIDSAEYWDSDKSRMMQLFAMAKAAVTGKPPTDIGEHKKIVL
ncbi:MAG: pyridoxamine 5'-phosphate oxidase family protein [Herminiimonas sp.]|nr:pyridoxamine 5'-phosphate oxidase family protein [Herminiimonas sp.]